MTSLVIGASSVQQLDANLDALEGPAISAEEIAAIDQDATDAGINLWAGSSAD
jgi:L-glyceraldehyde 3-phosphate reductase